MRGNDVICDSPARRVIWCVGQEIEKIMIDAKKISPMVERIIKPFTSYLRKLTSSIETCWRERVDGGGVDAPIRESCKFASRVPGLCIVEEALVATIP